MTFSAVNYLNLIKEYGKYLLAGFFYVLLYKILFISSSWLMDFFWYLLLLSLFFGIDYLLSCLLNNIFVRRVIVYFLAGFFGIFFIPWLSGDPESSLIINTVNFLYLSGLVAFAQVVYHKNRSKEFDLDSSLWLLVLGSMFVAVDGLFYFILHSQVFWKLVITLMIGSWHIVYWRDFFTVRREQADETIIIKELKTKKEEDEMVIDLAEKEENDFFVYNEHEK